jgi:hypothetical protein
MSILVTEYKTVHWFLPRACWIGLGFFFHAMKIRYTGILVKIMRQPYPENDIIRPVVNIMHIDTVSG